MSISPPKKVPSINLWDIKPDQISHISLDSDGIALLFLVPSSYRLPPFLLPSCPTHSSLIVALPPSFPTIPSPPCLHRPPPFPVALPLLPPFLAAPEKRMCLGVCLCVCVCERERGRLSVEWICALCPPPFLLSFSLPPSPRLHSPSLSGVPLAIWAGLTQWQTGGRTDGALTLCLNVRRVPEWW